MFELRPYNRRRVSTYNPFRELEALEKAFFENPFRDTGNFIKEASLSDFKTDITDEGDHFLLVSDLPGFDKKDINIEIDNENLTISAERKSEVKDEEKDKYICMERSYGKYVRQFGLEGINSDEIKAKYENGVLRLELPKKKEEKPETRTLEIE